MQPSQNLSQKQGGGPLSIHLLLFNNDWMQRANRIKTRLVVNWSQKVDTCVSTFWDPVQFNEAYYFLGYVSEVNDDLYDKIQKAGFLLKFREHSSSMMGKKKGNVDSDIIFSVMKKLYRKYDFDKIILVSGDGDYKMLVDFLIKESRFKKILFPNKQFASSLYKKITRVYFDYLLNVKHKIELK